MKRIILTLGLLVIVVSCAQMEQDAQERRTPVAGSSPVSTQPTAAPPTATPISTAPTLPRVLTTRDVSATAIK